MCSRWRCARVCAGAWESGKRGRAAALGPSRNKHAENNENDGTETFSSTITVIYAQLLRGIKLRPEQKNNSVTTTENEEAEEAEGGVNEVWETVCSQVLQNGYCCASVSGSREHPLQSLCSTRKMSAQSGRARGKRFIVISFVPTN